MGFSKEWDERYRAGEHMSVWPWSDLVRLVRKYCPDLGPEHTVLELGCGAGANIPFFLSLDVEYYGVDGSRSVVEGLWERFEEIDGQIFPRDFTESAFLHDESCDLVVDRSAITHNDTDGIKRALGLAWNALKPGGLYIGVDWWSASHSESRRGIEVRTGSHTRFRYSDGPFSRVGKVHFTTGHELKSLFREWEVLHTEHKIRTDLATCDTVAAYDIVARKP
jgi:SAM-dependent methyltransferase